MLAINLSNRIVALLIYISIGACCGCINASAQTVYSDFYDGVIIFKVKDKSAYSQVPLFVETLPEFDKSTPWTGLIHQYGITSVQKAAIIPDPYLDLFVKIKFTEFNKIHTLIEALEALSYIELAEKEPIVRPFYEPNDFSTSGDISLQIINAFDAFDYTRGDSLITLAIVDDGVQYSHTDLAANIWRNPGEIPNDAIDNDNNGFVDDVVGYDVADQDANPTPDAVNGRTHGTHCAGIAGAVTDNGAGVASIGFGISIICVKTAPNNAPDDNLTDAYAGVQYAIAARANVISMSWGGGGSSTFHQGIINVARARGAVCVAAAGNDDMALTQYPAGYQGVICVGATAPNDVRASFSNYGGNVDVMAPGVNINSTLSSPTSNTRFGRLSGTSMACPMAAGLCGLMLSYNPTLTPDILEAALKASCDNIDLRNPNQIGQLGAGRINAGQAIRAARPTTCQSDTIDNHVVGIPSLIVDSLHGSFPTGNHDTFSIPASAKAQLFESYFGYNLLKGIDLQFAKATATTPNANVVIQVLSAGDRQWLPTQPILSSDTLSISQIAQDIASGQRTHLAFSQALEVKGKFYVSVLFGNQAGDTVVLAATPTQTQNHVLELVAGSWQPIESRWGVSLALAAFPVMTSPEANLTATFAPPVDPKAGEPQSFSAITNTGRLFSWSFSGNFRTGRNTTFTFDTAGTYTVILNVFDGRCYKRDTQLIVVNAPQSIQDEELIATDYILWPNPAGSMLNIGLKYNASSPSLIQHISIFDMMGREVYQFEAALIHQQSNTQVQLSVPDLPTGLYYLVIQDNSGSHSLRFCKL